MKDIPSIPNGRPSISEEDIVGVVETLHSKWWTTGPKIKNFESAFANYVESKYAVAVSSGTAALELAIASLGIDSGEIITTPLTFVATANAILYNNLTPVFVDIDPNTLNINPQKVLEAITPRTRAILCVDYAGHPCDIDTLRKIADEHDLFLIEDAAHAIGAEYRGKKVGSLADVTTFSFHPVKNMSTGEGGMITTNNQKMYNTLCSLRNHGLDKSDTYFGGSWSYDLKHLGRNFRLTDFQSSLGISQLQRINEFNAVRKSAVARYKQELALVPEIELPQILSDVKHAWHLFVILLKGIDRNVLFKKLAERGVKANVHYIPIYKFSFYKKFDFDQEKFPVTEDIFSRILTLPLYNDMTLNEVDYVVKALQESIKEINLCGGNTK